jgi:uncharacterized membrane protein
VAAALHRGAGRLACAAFCVGMALFTVVMGNGFAAFPIIVFTDESMRRL